VAAGFTGAVRAVYEHSFVRFAVVGGLCFAVDLAALFLLHGVWRLWLPVATLAAYLVAFALSFALSRGWVFPAGGRLDRQIWRYLAVFAAVVGLTVLGVQWLVWLSLPYLIAKVFTSGVVAVLNYAASRWWVFR
jgi:putative flippase GtrA